MLTRRSRGQLGDRWDVLHVEHGRKRQHGQVVVGPGLARDFKPKILERFLER